MATTINATTTGLVETSDGTAVLALQTGGTTAVTINATQALGVGSSPSYGTAGQFLTSGGSGAAPTWTSGGSGTVTSVGWTGGIVSIASATTTPAFTIAGTSGGIPYFSGANTWASSAALTQYGVVFGGGAGAAPDTTAAGTTGQFLGANTGAAPTWKSVSATPGGTNTQVQYNSSGSFAGSANFVFISGTGASVKGANGSLTSGVANLKVGITDSPTVDYGANLILTTNITATNDLSALIIKGATENISSYATYGAFATVTAAGIALESCRINSSQYLLVGYTASNGAYKLQVNSQIFATNAVIATSDGRYKKDVSPITSGLDLVNKLNPVSFNWKTHPVHDFDTENVDVGFIAQDVQSALSDSPYLSNVVKSNQTTLPDGTKEDFLGIADGKLIPILVKAIQELTARLEALEAK